MNQSRKIFQVVSLTICASILLVGCTPNRTINSTRDLVNKATVPDGLAFISEGSQADAVDDVAIKIAPLFEGDTPITNSGLAPMVVTRGQGSSTIIDIDFVVSSFDTTEGVARCAVYYDQNLIVEDVQYGNEPVAKCEGTFDILDYMR